MYSQKEFKYTEYEKVYKKEKNKDSNNDKKYSLIMNLIRKYIQKSEIEKVMDFKDYYLSRMLVENTGEFYHQTIYSAKQKNLIPLKHGKSTQKYGGYSNEYKAYCVIFKYINSKGNVEYELIGVPVQVSSDIKQEKLRLKDYILNTYLVNKNVTQLEIIKDKILINQEYLDENNNLMRLCSDKEVRNSKELIVNKEISKLIYLMNKDEKYLDDEEIDMIKKEYINLYDYLVKKLENEYKVFDNVLKRLQDKYEKFEKLSDKEKCNKWTYKFNVIRSRKFICIRIRGKRRKNVRKNI